MPDTPTTRRSRIKLREGDVFELAVPDGRLGYGVVVKGGVLKNGGTPYVAILKNLYVERANLRQLEADQVALAGWTMDGSFYRGDWKIIDHSDRQPDVSLPNFKVEDAGTFYVTDIEGKIIRLATPAEQKLLDFQFSRSPRLFQDAFEALHGLREWRDDYKKLTPAYSLIRTLYPLM